MRARDEAILVIDDEERADGDLLTSLSQLEHPVLVCRRADDVQSTIETHRSNLWLIILDVMMPPGQFGVEATDAGLRTGVLLYKQIRRILPTINILALTFQFDLSKSDFNAGDTNLVVRNKLRFEPANVVACVNELSRGLPLMQAAEP
jgi:CheY-like chemotaxis protein